MPWGRIDDSLYEHPKLDALGPSRLACVGLNTLAISWSNRWLTDGFIPADRVRKLGGTLPLADKLVLVGLWEHAGTDYRIHDFLEYNDSAAEIKERRLNFRDLGKRGGIASGEARRLKRNGSTDNEADRLNRQRSETVEAPSRPVPSISRPVPSDAREANPENSHDDRLDGPLAYSEVTTRYPQPGSDLHEWTMRLAEEHGAVPFQKALATEFTINRSGKDLMSRTESRLARQADEALVEFTKNRDTDRAATRAERTARELREVREKEARIAVEPMKPLSELMPNLRIGTRPPGKPS